MLLHILDVFLKNNPKYVLTQSICICTFLTISNENMWTTFEQI